jgi:hypothetical protein
MKDPAPHKPDPAGLLDDRIPDDTGTYLGIEAIRDHIDEYNAELDAAVDKDRPVCPLE